MTTAMRCHYEVLGVDRDADVDLIKKAYRKLALKWHPDKNLENMEQATLEFRLVQQAYDVLSDIQERAWYDKHREAILRGGLGHGDTYKDECLDVYAYFNSACFSGYDDSDTGFYGVYQKVFATIAEEDYIFIKDKDSDYKLPGFGNSESDYNVVKMFYGYWESYCTARSYVWCEKYDTREAPDRATRRAMEADNRKICEAKRKERNDEVRALVQFVRKRDRRVAANRKRLEERALEIQRLAKERQLEEKKAQIRQMENYQETEWSANVHLEDHLQKLEDELAQEFQESVSSSDEENSLSNLVCVVCSKAFKTDRAFQNHEKSKKHREMVALVKEEMKAEESEFMLHEEEEPFSEEKTPTKLSKKQKKKRKQQQKIEDSQLEEESSNQVLEEYLCERVSDIQLNDEKNNSFEMNHKEDSRNDSEDSKPKSTKVKKKSKKIQEPSTNIAAKDLSVEESDKDTDLECKICKQVMPSRNKLFDHIKKTGHATIKAPDGTITDERANDRKVKKKGKKR